MSGLGIGSSLLGDGVVEFLSRVFSRGILEKKQGLGLGLEFQVLGH